MTGLGSRTQAPGSQNRNSRLSGLVAGAGGRVSLRFLELPQPAGGDCGLSFAGISAREECVVPWSRAAFALWKERAVAAALLLFLLGEGGKGIPFLTATVHVYS